MNARLTKETSLSDKRTVWYIISKAIFANVLRSDTS